jgi:hypothetical protein
VTLRAAAVLLCAGAAAATSAAATAQPLPLERGIGFSLKPRQGLLPRISSLQVDPRLRARIGPIERVAADDRVQDIQIGLQRMTHRMVTDGTATPIALSILPRSRLTRYMVEDRLPIGDHVIAAFGWHGIKLSNRNANVTVGTGSERLRTRDWFLPRAALTLRPGGNLSMTIGYTETLRAFGETGLGGPMGLTRDEFQSLRRTLKPETQSRMQLRADWAATPALDLSIAVHGGRLDDRLAFVGRGTLPVNSGSARIEGAVLEASHRLTPQLRWSLRYGDARLRVSGGNALRERSLAIGSVWEEGPWSVSARAVRNGAPALSPHSHRALRVEAGVEYAVARIGERPLRLSVRMTDPDRLASTSFALNDLSGPLRAADQARAVMASARFDW